MNWFLRACSCLLLFTSHRRKGARLCLLCFCRPCLCVLTCFPASAALGQVHSVLSDCLQQLRISDSPKILGNSEKKNQDLAGLPTAASSNTNGASLRKTQQFVQQTREIHSLPNLQDEEIDGRAFFPSYSNCMQVIGFVTHIYKARITLGINSYCCSCKVPIKEFLSRKL